MKITGAGAHSRRLGRLAGPQMKRRVYQALFVAGSMIETEAEISITAGSVSGKNHVPSAPGEPPNADTRLLDTSIETTGDPEAVKVTVTSNAPYSAALEFGTSRMEERPFMRPATAKKRPEAVRLVHTAMARLAKEG